MHSKKMVMIFAKAVVVIFVLCFAVVQLAAINKKPDSKNRELIENPDFIEKAVVPNGEKNNEGDVPHHLRREPDSLDSNDQHLIEPVQVIKQDNPELRAENVIKQAPLNVNGLAVDSVVDGAKLKDVQGNDGLVDKPLVPPQAQKPQLEKPDGQNHVIVEAVERDSQIEEPKQNADIQNVKHPQDKADEEDEGEEEEDEDEEEGDDEFPPHRLVDVKRLSLNELQPPDHMDGVRMEQDGHLNRDFKKEIILGNHEEFERQSDVDQEELLENIFKKVDMDEDNFVTLAELEKWIILKVQEHFLEANEEAERIFKHLDTEEKGAIRWQDFHIHFLVAKGHEPSVAKKHATDYETIPLDPDEKERLIRYKFRWAEADEEPQDNKLTLNEFKAFRHPEQSVAMLNRMVQDIIDNLDQNNDGEVTEEEFIALPPGEVDGQFVESDKAWQEERRKEFQKVIDINHDGKITRDELKNYVDPQNPNHGRLEAENLIQLADENGDEKLSLDEVLDNPELFLGSKMVDTGKNFHDEF